MAIGSQIEVGRFESSDLLTISYDDAEPDHYLIKIDGKPLICGSQESITNQFIRMVDRRQEQQRITRQQEIRAEVIQTRIRLIQGRNHQ